MVGYLAWQNGQALREENRTTAFYEQMATQVTLARQDMDQQKYRLAQRRLEWVLERDPNQAEAAQLLAEVLARLNIFLTPLPTGAPPTATPRTMYLGASGALATTAPTAADAVRRCRRA
jgi:alkyl sulfatase BDS1-like metallo-beta-lactamase superfamily hydrolase